MDGVDGGVMTTQNKKREQAVMGGKKNEPDEAMYVLASSDIPI